MAFALHPQLAADSSPVLDLDLCSVRLMNAAALPWLLLIPQREHLRELIDLDVNDQKTFWHEVAGASTVLKNEFNPTKLNVAALGNVVPQLHMHVIARYDSDAAWPKPVWGNLPISPYEPATLSAMISRLQIAFKKHG